MMDGRQVAKSSWTATFVMGRSSGRSGLRRAGHATPITAIATTESISALEGRVLFLCRGGPTYVAGPEAASSTRFAVDRPAPLIPPALAPNEVATLRGLAVAPPRCAEARLDAQTLS